MRRIATTDKWKRPDGEADRAGGTAFTLIELLVVISIIGLLAAILLPALARAKASAWTVICANSLHQLGVAETVYLGDNGRYPDILDWLYARSAPNNLASGQLYPYLKTKDIYLCPADKREMVSKGQSQPSRPLREHSYLMNCMMCHAHDSVGCMSPAQSLMLLEGTNTPVFILIGPEAGMAEAPQPPPAPLPPWSTFAYRHNRRGNMLMGDMHVQKLTKKEFDTAERLIRFWYPNSETTRSGGL